MHGDTIEVKRIDFENGGTLDGPLLAQLLRRLRVAEQRLATVQQPPPAAGDLQTVEYTTGTAFSLGLTNILVFRTGTTIQAPELLTAPVNTVYHLWNQSNAEVAIGNGTTILLRIVPGEAVKFFRLSTGWSGTFGP